LSFFENPKFYDLISRTINPSKRVQSIVENVIHAAGTWLNIVLLLVLIGLYQWWLVPILIFLATLSSRYEMKLGERIREFERNTNVINRERGYAAQLLTNRDSVVEVKLFGLNNELTRRWSDWFNKIHTSRLKF